MASSRSSLPGALPNPCFAGAGRSLGHPVRVWAWGESPLEVLDWEFE